MAASQQPFKIDVPDEDLQLLKQKLELASYPDELENADWQLGTPLSEIRRLTENWKSKFDWRKQEAELNKLPQFTSNVDVPGFGQLSIHYVYQRSAAASAVPLLFLHGCKCVSPATQHRRNAVF
jgi:hypothetical protein